MPSPCRWWSPHGDRRSRGEPGRSHRGGRTRELSGRVRVGGRVGAQGFQAPSGVALPLAPGCVLVDDRPAQFLVQAVDLGPRAAQPLVDPTGLRSVLGELVEGARGPHGGLGGGRPVQEGAQPVRVRDERLGEMRDAAVRVGQVRRHVPPRAVPRPEREAAVLRPVLSELGEDFVDAVTLHQTVETGLPDLPPPLPGRSRERGQGSGGGSVAEQTTRLQYGLGDAVRTVAPLFLAAQPGQELGAAREEVEERDAHLGRLVLVPDPVDEARDPGLRDPAERAHPRTSGGATRRCRCPGRSGRGHRGRGRAGRRCRAAPAPVSAC